MTGHELDGWAITGFQAMVALWMWLAVVLTHGLWRSATRPQPDKVRSSGPVR